MLNVNDKVPSFSLQNQDGEWISNTDLIGKKYILFFYPKDDSPGCTKGACSIRDKYKYISRLGYEVFGVSPDKFKKHRKFIDKYEFQYSLLADPERNLIESFGVWGPKKFMGKEIVGVYRSSFVIDETGTITSKLDSITTKLQGDQVLTMLNELQDSQVSSMQN